MRIDSHNMNVTFKETPSHALITIAVENSTFTSLGLASMQKTMHSWKPWRLAAQQLHNAPQRQSM